MNITRKVKEIEAIQFTGENQHEVATTMQLRVRGTSGERQMFDDIMDDYWVKPGDWVLRLENGDIQVIEHWQFLEDYDVLP